MLDVSVVVPARNAAHMLDTCLSSMVRGLRPLLAAALFVEISIADARATRLSKEGSQVQAMPSCVGKMVAPGQNE